MVLQINGGAANAPSACSCSADIRCCKVLAVNNCVCSPTVAKPKIIESILNVPHLPAEQTDIVLKLSCAQQGPGLS